LNDNLDIPERWTEYFEDLYVDDRSNNDEVKGIQSGYMITEEEVSSVGQQLTK